jgi:hypothetical protein
VSLLCSLLLILANFQLNCKHTTDVSICEAEMGFTILGGHSHLRTHCCTLQVGQSTACDRNPVTCQAHFFFRALLLRGPPSALLRVLCPSKTASDASCCSRLLTSASSPILRSHFGNSTTICSLACDLSVSTIWHWQSLVWIVSLPLFSHFGSSALNSN